MDQLRYIIDLFDDADPGVVAAVDKYFLENGPVALSRLRSVCKGELDPVKGAIAGKMLVRYNKMLALRDLRSIAGSAAKRAIWWDPFQTQPCHGRSIWR